MSGAQDIEPEPSAGPLLLSFVQAAPKSLSELSFVLEINGRQIQVTAGRSCVTWLDKPEPHFLQPVKDIVQAIVTLARTFSGASLQLQSVVLRKDDRSVELQPELLALAIKAVCERLGQPIPTEESLARCLASPEAIRARLIENELKGGAAGIQKWNARTRDEFERAGSFAGTTLAGAELCDVLFRGFKFQGSVFDGAKLDGAVLEKSDFSQSSFAKASLAKAKLGYAIFTGANFESADLSGVDGQSAGLDEANFVNANLTAADLSSCNLRGSNLSGARLDQARLKDAAFDAQTIFPQGFVPPVEMEWAGSGPNPFFDQQQLSFEDFVEVLHERTGYPTWNNAAKMLQSKRYQLFSEIKAQEVLGIVRSQSDKELVYSCRLTAEGAFCCCTQNLKACGGLKGRICKHILVLVIGLIKAGKLAPKVANLWINHSRQRAPKLDKDRMAETFVRYHSAQAGELDWRPTETVPEDYLGL